MRRSPAARSRASIMACPVPSCSLCRTKPMPVDSSAASHPVRFMPDDGEDVLRRDHAGSGYDMGQQRLAADFMQHFGVARFQPRAFSGGENGDGEHEVRLLGCRREAELWLSHNDPFSFGGLRLRSRGDYTGLSRSSIISRSRSCATRWVSWRAISPSAGASLPSGSRPGPASRPAPRSARRRLNLRLTLLSILLLPAPARPACG